MFRWFENLVDPYADYPETDTPPRTFFAFVKDWSRPFYKLFAFVGAVTIAVAAIEIWLLSYMGHLIDLISASTPETFWADHGTEMIIVVVFLLILRPMIEVVGTLAMNSGVMPNYGTLFRWRAHKQVMRQSVGWFENDFAGRIANRIMQTPPAAGDMIFQVFDAITFSLAYLVGAFVLLSTADPRLAIPLLLWFILYSFVLRWVVINVAPASKASSEARSMTTGRVVDSYTNIHAVKLFAHHDQELDYAKEAIEETRRTFAREMRLYALMDMAMVVLNGVLIVSVVGYAIFLWSNNLASVGIIAAATALTLRLNAMTYWIIWALTDFFRAVGVVKEGMETITDPITLVDAANAEQLTMKRGEITFKKATHHYGKDTGGLSNINLTIQPGEKIGLVGRSGAGKSTLVKLLLRFYDIEGGQILIDGQDIRSVTQASLRAQIGMVQQDSTLLHRSVRDNIAYGRPDASDAQIIEAAKQAEAHEFILTLEDPQGRTGYDAHVGERGVKLSGGQRQRVSLARVILKDAPILVLDEATSALDSEVEAAIQDTLYGMMEGKTVIAIAHRLSTIAQMDRIVVLDDGAIIEEGSHKSLLAAKGLYASFWARQSGGFIGLKEAG